MALKGTLKDFGIADILQLIGQQTKTGILTLTNRGEEVAVSFKDGNIVRAETTSRNRKDLIGSMLVRANLITDNQLDFALETQKRTLQRLGDVLVSHRVITAEKFSEMVQLQTSETLYRLFTWKSGTYAFEQVDVEEDPSLTPLRAESVLMEGFRRVDEWPVVKKKITTYQMTFERKKDLPAAPAPAADAFDAALDDAFAEEKKSENKGEFQSVGENERRVYGLVASGRTVQGIIDLSLLGEFETAKALCNLINLDYLVGVAPSGKVVDETDEGPLARLAGLAGRVAITALVVGSLYFVGAQTSLGSFRLGSGNATTFTDPAAQRFASAQQRSRIEAALEVYRLETGDLPESLESLADTGILSANDLRYPWREMYYYRRTEPGRYVLLPPLR
ncbi:MAG: DUF4388 domain-containing protein [Archangium sp.]|nr:DUF4388 domain-containing protein [Archangium sp.]